MKTLPPQRLTDSTWSQIEDQVRGIFYQVLFAPILAIINQNSANPIELKNAAGSVLLHAIQSGRIQYKDGVFSGKFSVAISNALRLIGGRFDSRTGTYRIDIASLPGWIKAEAANYQLKAKAVHDEILRKLDEVQERIGQKIDEYHVNPYYAIEKIESGFKVSAKALEIQPELDVQRKAQLAADYNQNMKLYIKKFSEQSIVSLREVVEENSMQGYRFDRLKDVIKQRYGVTANKAKFLARQETSLFQAKFRANRFEQAGVKNYRWATAHDERVRDDHKRLNGKVFSYQNPPIQDRNTGERGNPGEGYNCRCLDIPILSKVAEYA